MNKFLIVLFALILSEASFAQVPSYVDPARTDQANDPNSSSSPVGTTQTAVPNGATKLNSGMCCDVTYNSTDGNLHEVPTPAPSDKSATPAPIAIPDTKSGKQ